MYNYVGLVVEIVIFYLSQMTTIKKLFLRYKGKRMFLSKVDFDYYATFDLVFSAKSVVVEHDLDFPQYPMFFYNEPSNENVRHPLVEDKNLIHMWNLRAKEDEIDIMMVENDKLTLLNKLFVDLENRMENEKKKNEDELEVNRIIESHVEEVVNEPQIDEVGNESQFASGYHFIDSQVTFENVSIRDGEIDDEEDSDSEYNEEIESEGDSDEVSLCSETSNESEEERDEHPFAKVYQGIFWKPENDGSVKIEEWNMFPNKETLVHILCCYFVQEGFSVHVKKSDKKRYSAECKGKQCTWRIHASILPDTRTWAIKTIRGTHTCCEKVEKNENASYHWVAEMLKNDVMANPEISIKAMSTLLMQRYGLKLETWTIRSAKKKIIASFMGKYEDSYLRLGDYVQRVKETNPDSIVDLKWDENVPLGEKYKFERVFISFKAITDGFVSSCRRFIGIDGTHLMGEYKGILLSAIGLDGDNGCVPIAYAVVEQENFATWKYFFLWLRGILGVGEYEKWTFISDRQKVHILLPWKFTVFAMKFIVFGLKFTLNVLKLTKKALKLNENALKFNENALKLLTETLHQHDQLQMLVHAANRLQQGCWHYLPPVELL